MKNPYVKSVRHLDEIDIYQIGNLYEVKSHAVFHALKKLLCAGKRGAKDYEQDLMEAIESIERELQIICEDEDKIERGPHDHTFSMVGAAGRMRRKFKREAADMQINLDNPAEFDEQRMDVIGQNGNEGEHYGETWIEWNGGDCPVDPEATVQTMLFGFNGISTGKAKTMYWQHDKKDMAGCIKCYRIIEDHKKNDWRSRVNWADGCSHHEFAYPNILGTITYSMDPPIDGEYVYRRLSK